MCKQAGALLFCGCWGVPGADCGLGSIAVNEVLANEGLLSEIEALGLDGWSRVWLGCDGSFFRGCFHGVRD